MIAPASAWRCFPGDPAALAGQPFSASHIRPGQRTGRFDLHDHPPILYLSDESAHAIAETLQAFRNLAFLPGMLRRHGHALAVAEVSVSPGLAGRLADLCDPEVLTRLRMAPDLTAHHDRTVTQPLARQIYEADDRYAGLRWWSTVTGAWHTLALFTDRLTANDVTFQTPRPLTADDPDVSLARQMLNVR